MEIKITGKNIKITKSIRDYINKRITKVISDFEHPVNCDIVLEVEKKRHITEIILSGDSGRFYFKKTADDLYKSIDNTVQTADISIKKFKQKQKNHKFKDRKSIKRKEYAEDIRIKKIEVKDIKPMTIEEAVLQLKYIKQNILVFQNAGNFQTHVLFENKERYNLIQQGGSFFSKFLFKRFKKNKYNILLLSYNNNKIRKIKRKRAVFNSLPYSQAFNEIVHNRDLNYLIFENDDSKKINILFRINNNLIGYYEFR